MAQPDFVKPDFLEDCSVDEIHQRMMNNLPEDIDSTPGGFPYDLTRPTAIEKSEMLDFYLVRALMIMFPQFAWDEWLDLHGKQVSLTRHPATCATGFVKVTGEPGYEIDEGTIFCTPATDTTDSYEYTADQDYVIGEEGYVVVAVTAVDPGPESNVPAESVTLMDDPDEDVSSVTNEEPITGGADEETDDDFFDRIAIEYDNSNTFLGNDSDYIRWAKEAGTGGCIVDSESEGVGSVKLVLVDTNGDPASQELCDAVFNYIVSPNDRSKRLLPTACARLICAAAVTSPIDFTCTGLVYEATTDIAAIKAAFSSAVKGLFNDAKTEGVLRYNDVRPLISQIDGVTDFATFLMDGDTENITIASDDYPAVGTLNFS